MREDAAVNGNERADDLRPYKRRNIVGADPKKVIVSHRSAHQLGGCGLWSQKRISKIYHAVFSLWTDYPSSHGIYCN